MYLSSESLSDANEDDDVREWNDISGNGRDVSVNSGCGNPRYGKASWNPSIPVVKFGYSGGQSCLKTKSAYPVSTSGTYLNERTDFPHSKGSTFPNRKETLSPIERKHYPK